MKYLHIIAYWLLVIGGLNWLAFALLNWDLGSLLGGMTSMGAKILYVLVGLSAIYEVVMHKGRCASTGSAAAQPMMQ